MNQTSGELVLVRHGETVGQSSIRLYGATDIALSELGERQIASAAEALKVEAFDAVVVSPLSRSRRSGEIVAAARAAHSGEPAPPLRVVEGFREINFGDWEGWTFAEAAARDPENYARWGSEGLAFQFPGGESRGGFRARVLGGLRGSTPPLFPPRGRTLATLHKGIIKILIGALCGLDHEQASALPVSLGGYYRLRHDGERWRVSGAQHTAHLVGELDLGG